MKGFNHNSKILYEAISQRRSQVDLSHVKHDERNLYTAEYMDIYIYTNPSVLICSSSICKNYWLISS